MASGGSTRRLARVCSAVLAAATLLAPAPATASESLDGRDIRLLIGLQSSSYQVYGQLFGKHLRERLPNSDINIETDDRAAGKMAAKRMLEAPDGRIVLGMLSNNMFYEYMLGDADSEFVFSPADFKWVGRFAENSRVLFGSEAAGMRSMADLRAHPDPVFVPTIQAVMSQTYQETLILNAALGLHLHPVPGYGGEATVLALLSGEGEAYNGSYLGKRHLVESGDVHVVLKLGGRNWRESLAELPTLREEARPEHSKVVDFIEFCAELSRWLVASPSMSARSLEAVREVFDAIVSDPAFVKELEKSNAPLSPLPGEQMEAEVMELFDDPGTYRAALRKAAACGQKRADDIDEDC